MTWGACGNVSYDTDSWKCFYESYNSQQQSGEGSRSMNSFRTVLKYVTGFSGLLITVLALNALLILAILMRDIGGSYFNWLTGLYTSSVALGYYGLPLLVVITVLFLLLLPERRSSAVDVPPENSIRAEISGSRV